MIPLDNELRGALLEDPLSGRAWSVRRVGPHLPLAQGTTDQVDLIGHYWEFWPGGPS